MRSIVLDTETTGLEPAAGHRIIEIGGVEMINRKLTGKRFHVYLNPERDIDPGAVEVHGLSAQFLADKPKFPDIALDFLEFIRDAELIIHNAPFDVGFLNSELLRIAAPVTDLQDYCVVIDTLVMARKKHPGQRNNLDALCKRYGVDNSKRELHGALLDAEILADVYLAMTGGQVTLGLELDSASQGRAPGAATMRRKPGERPPLKVTACTEQELESHRQRLEAIDKASKGKCLWLKL